MLKKRFNPSIELKKVQKKGVYNPKTKVIGIFGVLISTVLIVSSYALWNYVSENNIAFNGKATKMVKISISAPNAKVGVFATKILEDNEIQEGQPDFTKDSPSGTTDNGKGLFASNDNDGTSYYFRGAVDNNNVIFAGEKWKIVRINGDGSIRLIYNGNDGPGTSGLYTPGISGSMHKYVGYTFDNSHECTQEQPCTSDFQNGSFKLDYGTKEANDNGTKIALEEWYARKLASANDKIALTTFCNDTSNNAPYKLDTSNYSGDVYSPVYRIENNAPSLKCSDPLLYGNLSKYGGVYKLKIGLLTIDEINMAGFGASLFSSVGSNNYLYKVLKGFNGSYYLSMSPYTSLENSESHNEIYVVYYDHIESAEPYGTLVPVINLKPDVSVSGSGTEESPYVVSDTYSSSNIEVKAKYNTNKKIKFIPDSNYMNEYADCFEAESGSSVSSSYSNETNEFTVKASTDLVCSLSFKRNLKGTILANNKVQTTAPSSDNFINGSGSSGLFSALDNDGTSYYFRGNVTNNYVSFANKTWRIVRINGDGTVRLIFDVNGTVPINSKYNSSFVDTGYSEDSQYIGYTFGNPYACTQKDPCISDYKSSVFQNNNRIGEDSTAKTTLEAWYTKNLAYLDDRIALTTYCNDTSENDRGFYNSEERLYRGPSLICPNPTESNGNEKDYGGVYKLKIGLLTSDEMNMAGSPYYYTDNLNFYLNVNLGYSMTPRNYHALIWLGSYLQDEYFSPDYELNMYPVINLKATVDFSVNSSSTAGTSSNPYVIK